MAERALKNNTRTGFYTGNIAPSVEWSESKYYFTITRANIVIRSFFALNNFLILHKFSDFGNLIILWFMTTY